MELRTRQEALSAGLLSYFTGAPCKHGHIALRSVANKTCFICSAEGKKRKSSASREKDRLRKQAWYEARRPDQLEQRRRNYQENKEERRAAGIAYRAERKQEQAARRRAHYEANKQRYIAQVRARQLTLKKALPSWADLEAITEIYAEAARIQKSTGIPHNVDHFYPIRGKTVCGLHVENNLRIITAAENMEKKDTVPTTCESW